ncbi:hypothetical protein PhCBS80983_g03773 [Powellomyces hirtus]|uniref:Glucosidase 2 subunit beta n=1 Tax=Powellomyces hirtus TaxID=109895 RepID=A0A507E100_9FUNG|nr:hypothetical protein PhCBS80983_g03773 [Powellomyces hirtus]
MTLITLKDLFQILSIFSNCQLSVGRFKYTALALLQIGAGCLHVAANSKDSKWTPDRALLGVHPSRRTTYTASASTDMFRCLDNSKEIPFVAVNDDYCDCPDGSDEPGTSACEKGVFHCKNENHLGADIPSSRVNDGICDPECCDGSDEYLGIVQCNNTCMETGESHRKKVEAERRLLAEGEKIAREYAIYAAKQASERASEIAQTTNKLEMLEKQVKKLTEMKTTAETLASSQTEEERAEEEKASDTTNTQGKCCPTRKKCKEMLEEQIGHNLLLQDRIDYLQEGVYHIENFSEAVRNDDVAVRDTFDLYDNYKLDYMPDPDEEDGSAPSVAAEPIPESTPEASSESASASAPRTDCCTKVKECRKRIGEEQENFLHLHDKLESLVKVFQHMDAVKAKSKREDEWVERAFERYADYRLQYRGEKIPPMPNVDELDVSRENRTEPITEPHVCDMSESWTDPRLAITECVPKYARSLWKEVANKVVQWSSPKPKSGGVRQDPIKIAAKLIEAQGAKTEAEAKLAELNNLKGIDFGPAGVWEKLYKQCFSTDALEYTYEVCLHDKAQQKPKSGAMSTGLGTFTRWGAREQGTEATKYKYMMYENGDRCWNGPARSVEVSLECGLETKLFSVVEMSKCEYSAKLRSPAACELSHENVLPPAWHSKDEL